MSHLIKPFQLLEINIISGQDLELVSKNMRTYATAWVHPKRKLSTSVDSQGGNNPTWNDKFVFRVDEEFLRLDTSAVMIEIYASHWFRDTLVGSVRVLVGNLIPPPTHPRHHHHHHHSGMRFAALHVRRPSGRPQGILNIGVAVLDSSMRSMPLYTQLSTSAVGFHDLMGEEGPNHHNHPNNYPNSNLLPPILRRSRSERSDRLTFDDLSTTSGSIVGTGQKKGLPGKASSMLSGSEYSTVAPKGKNKKGKASSLLSGSEYSTTNPRGKTNKGKASSVISAAEFREKPIENGKKVKASSVINGSIVSKDSHKEKPISDPPNEKLNDPTSNNDKKAGEKSPAKSYMSGVVIGLPTKEGSASATAIGKPPISKLTSYEFGGPKGSSIANGKYIHGPPPPPQPQKAHSIWTDSEVGPSPSEVATAMMMARERERYTYTVDDNQSSVLDGWSIDESVEGLRSKLERWRTELPPLYDRGGGGGGFAGSSSYRSTSQHVRRHTDGGGGSGLFSCFGNIYGYECQIICGKPPDGRRSLSGRFQSPSASAGRSFH